MKSRYAAPGPIAGRKMPQNRRGATRRRTINLALRMKLYRRQTEERRRRSDVPPRTCDKIKLRQIDGRENRRRISRMKIDGKTRREK